MEIENKKNKYKKLGIISGTIIAMVTAVFVVTAMIGINPVDINNDDKVLEWHVVSEVNSWDIVGENSPGAGASGWLSTFCLDYGETPGTVLANNATDWSSSATARGYVDTDDTDTDLKSEDPFYFVVRARFNDSVKDGADFIGSRCRCTLTVSGDETISGVAQTGDDDGSDNNGGGEVSQNGTSYIWINFWWDDNSDGYRITDDGTLPWSITIEAKY